MIRTFFLLLLYIFATELVGKNEEHHHTPYTMPMPISMMTPEELAFFRQARHQRATIDRLRRPRSVLPTRIDLEAEDRFEEVSPIHAQFSGYILYLLFGDSRQMIGAGDNYLIIVPEKKVLDVCGNDINARGQFGSSMLETRMRVELHGPQLWGAESFGYLEGDAFGSNQLINRWRIRHAYIKLAWPTVSVLFGQFWHPIYISDAECYPNTIGFDGGAPIEPFARQPQIRITKEWQNVRLIAAALSQLGFLTNGPIGFSSTYIRDAVVPNLHGQLHYYKDKDNLAGIAVDYKRIVPRLVSNNNIKVHESLSSISVAAFGSGMIGSFHIATKAGYLENSTDILTLGGYAVSAVNACTDEREYSSLRDAFGWLDIEFQKKWSPGLFLGFTKNLGANKPIIQEITDPISNTTERTIYTLLDGDIDYVLRIAPRLRVNMKPITLGCEIIFVRAAYGTIATDGNVEHTDPVNGVRVSFGAYLFF